jgi:hypothetical protein
MSSLAIAVEGDVKVRAVAIINDDFPNEVVRHNISQEM